MIEGDPAAVEAAARELRAAGARLADAADQVESHARQVTAEWEGTAAEAAYDRITFMAARTRIGAEAKAVAAKALQDYALELRDAQAAEAAAAAAHATATADQDHLRQALQGLPAGARNDPDHDALLRVATEAVSAAAQAMQAAVERERVASTAAARQVDAATAQLADMRATPPAPPPPAPPPPAPPQDEGWFSWSWGDVSTSAWDATKDTAGFFGGLAGIGDADAGDSWAALADAAAYAWDHPLEAGKAAISWDLLAEGEFDKWVGEAIPGAVAALATGGAGLAARGGRAGKELAEDADKTDPAANHAEQPVTPRPAPTVPARYAHLPVRDVAAGKKFGWNKELHTPAPDTVYRVDGRHVYVTDDRGRVSHVESELTYRDAEEAELHRNEHQQKVAGREHRLDIDQGGHLVAASLGGPGEAINLVAMARQLNGPGRDNWNALEVLWRDTLKADPDAKITVSIEVDYPEGSKRPEELAVEYSINGAPPEVRIFRQ